MKPGDIKKFAIEKGNHICKVEIMEVRQVNIPDDSGVMAMFADGVGVRREVPVYSNTYEIKNLYLCRRADNGTPVLAWAENLT